MELLLFIGVIILFVLVFNLKGRVSRLERELHKAQNNPAEQSQIQAQVPGQMPPTLTQPQPAAAPIQLGPNWPTLFFNWLKEDWLLKLGALLLLIGFGWLTTYAFLNNWIGPMGRITLGIVAGALILILGWWRIRTWIHQGSVFMVLGSTVILLTIFAAREIYGFFTPVTALAVMFISVAFVATASVKFKVKSLALVSLILAGIAPFLTNSPQSDFVQLFSYLIVVVLGTIWIVAITGWRDLTVAALLLVVFYSAPHFLYISTYRSLLLPFAYGFAAIFFLTNTLGILKRKVGDVLPDIIAAGGNGLFLLIWIWVAAPDQWKSLIISAWMIVFVSGAFLIFKLTRRNEPFYVYAGVGVAMIAAATAAQLQGAALTIAYTVEAAIICLVAYLLLKDLDISKRLSMLLIGPVLLSFSSVTSRAWSVGVIHEDFFVLLILGLAIFGLGLFFFLETKLIKTKPDQLEVILLVAGSMYFYLLLWLSLQAGLVNKDLAVMIALIIYTLIGLAIYIYAGLKESKELRVYAGLLLGFVVLRLLFVDVWKMQLAGRIITFFLIGALLMSTAFIGRKKS
ncbi:MAG: hypothetical protein A3H72_02020 [Candidatus Doudnabacteria bacterium RIFCSPLOWO2_02_FULL_48_8]|uniref:DUF2339 domain-containing protein n=1 Tax=Candidatus Doudnabacteria bacterium RIFCSPHIGHO2_01_FULL_46_24 TaxID=1817825 RepID=A0A1F5NT09_9BACT|nr:MAG: hypothetical protein A2720_04245 [Candidatus Doudnabacteria bacterium RIFCSPHIGHO2_01_FULL_46_24]OGE94141.1 MAG: hypothetical protein A3E98_02705 [Candidatus Doudnabacteria bacterium RIFCSPHIGHO2_12_FULL_48_11]OGE95583.1 MAG: hypothetical protein A3H72_02020 [Candidatus Doudnabacteria bacterium RIFCSPLOWO2_02_FULL_48_8]